MCETGHPQEDKIDPGKLSKGTNGRQPVALRQSEIPVSHCSA